MHVVVGNTSELERLIIRVQERVYVSTKGAVEFTREQAIEHITAYRPELGEALEVTL